MKNFKVYRIASQQTYVWLKEYHYAKRIPSISFAYGLYEKGVLCGVCTIGKPASPYLCIGVCGQEYSNEVYELNRLCIDNDTDNLLSWFLSKCLKDLGPMIVVSYADTAMQHHGYIYQATNWIYTGCTKERTDIGTPVGKHSRHYDANKKYPRKHRSSKHRYVYFTGSRKQRKKRLQALKYPVLSYPKGNNSKYETGAITKQQVLF